MTDSNETDDGAATPGANRLFGTAMVLIDKMSVSQRRSRVLERWLAISVALDILLSIALVFVFAGQVNLNSSFRVAQQKQNASLSLALIKSCQAGNANKAYDIELWNDILKTDHPKTAAQELTLLNLQRLVHVRDQPIDCIARYSNIISH